MGVQQSKPVDPREKLKKDLAERGVLLPPLFVLANEGDYDQNRDLADPLEPSPSLLSRLKQESLSYSILSRYMKPGLRITSYTAANGSASASFIPFRSLIEGDSINATTQHAELWSNPNAILHISNPWNDVLHIDLTYASKSSPTVAAAFNVSPNLKLSGVLMESAQQQQHLPTPNHEGITGWLSCQYRTSIDNLFQSQEHEEKSSSTDSSNLEEGGRSKIHLHVGTYVDLNLPHLSSLGVFNKNNDSRSHALHTLTSLTSCIPALHAYTSLQVPGCLLALQAKLPNSYDCLPQFSYMASVDVATDGPPLTATLIKTPTSSSFGFAQALQFDRWILNPVEVTCPKIRNTLCWAVELETTQGKAQALRNDDLSTSSSSSTTTTPKAGIAWQINRAVAIKLLAQPHDLSGAVIFKRWKQPRVVCSALFGSGPLHSMSWGNLLRFQGISFQVEIGDSMRTSTGKDSERANRFLYEASSSSSLASSKATKQVVSPDVPPTIATLPDQRNAPFLRKTTSE